MEALTEEKRMDEDRPQQQGRELEEERCSAENGAAPDDDGDAAMTDDAPISAASSAAARGVLSVLSEQPAAPSSPLYLQQHSSLTTAALTASSPSSSSSSSSSSPADVPLSPSAPAPPPAASSPSSFLVPASPVSPLWTPPRHGRAATALTSPSLSSPSSGPQSPAESPSFSPSAFASPSSSLPSRYWRKLQLYSPPSDSGSGSKRHRRSQTETLQSSRPHSRSLSTALPASPPLPPLPPASASSAAAVIPSSATAGSLSPSLFQSLHVDTASYLSDRFIPSRLSSSLEPQPAVAQSAAAAADSASRAGSGVEVKEERPGYEHLLRTELLGRAGAASASPSAVPSSPSAGSPSMSATLASSSSTSVGFSVASATRGPPPVRTFRFKSPKKQAASSSPYSLSPLSSTSASASSSPPPPPLRKIPRHPHRVLDAPALRDDFYLNLVDWSAANTVSVGLGSAVYLWSGSTGAVVRLCDLNEREGGGGGGDSVSSVAWSRRGRHLAVGTRTGEVQVWDVERQVCIRSLKGHKGRVGCVAWTASCIASGSRDKTVLVRDVRVSQAGGNGGSGCSVVQRYEGHRQEVCGLRWSPDEQQLASGGNDNRLLLWSPHSSTPQHVFTQHLAAVKALAWSPHQRHVLASGGGTADRHIRFFNTASFSLSSAHDTGSQVCQLCFSRTSAELLSTHGYSLNQMIVWRLPAMQPIATLTGHTYRVLYLALSPDGATAVTGAGDETLRFWTVFPSAKKERERGAAAAAAGGRRRAGVEYIGMDGLPDSLHAAGSGGAGSSDAAARAGRIITALPTSGQMR